MAKKIKIKQIKSTNGCKKDQIGTIKALGLKRINHVVEQKDCDQLRGMIFKVKHLVEIVD